MVSDEVRVPFCIAYSVADPAVSLYVLGTAEKWTDTSPAEAWGSDVTSYSVLGISA
jgi:hypothetical protein